MSHILKKEYGIIKLMLYSNGDECLGITGGWSNNTRFTSIHHTPPTKKAASVLLDVARNYATNGTNMITNRKFVMGRWKRIGINVLRYQFTGSGYRHIVFCHTRDTADPLYTPPMKSYAIDRTGEFLFDISEVTFDSYIGVYLNSNTSLGNCTLEFNKIWLEM